MNSASTAAISDVLWGMRDLIAKRGPLLVEVRFPGGAAAPDWHLCDDPAEFDELVRRLGPGAELHASSVWSLRSSEPPIVARL